MPVPASTPAPDSVRLRLVVAPEVRAGAPVPIVLRVENAGPRPAELYLRGRTVAFDVRVADAAGRVVWSRLTPDDVIPAIIQLRVLAPGEVLELRAEWDQRTAGGGRAAPGAYTARGFLLTDAPAPLETPPAPLRVAPE